MDGQTTTPKDSTAINPRFDILQSLKDTAQQAQQHNNEELNPFPIHALPSKAQYIVSELAKSLNYPVDYSAAVMLFTIGTANGNKHKLQIHNGMIAKTNLFFAIVGRPGANKSQPQTYFTSPLSKRDDIYDYQHKQELRKYRELQRSFKKTEGKTTDEEPELPICKKLLESNATTEAVFNALYDNPVGIGWESDELVSITANLARYSGGNDDAYLLTFFNGNKLKVSRKGDGQRTIKNIFLSLIGGIQPAALPELFRDGRKTNGFADRFLFAIPDRTIIQPLSSYDIAPQITYDWQTITNRLLDIDYSSYFDPSTGEDIDTSVTIRYSEPAAQIIYAWDTEATDIQNNETDEISSIYSKLRIYIHRLALTLQCFRYACHESPAMQFIDEEAARGAVELVRYFAHTAIIARDIISDNSNPLSGMAKTDAAFVEALSQNFVTKEAEQIADKLGISRRKLYDMLGNKKLFTKIKHGFYEKIV